MMTTTRRQTLLGLGALSLLNACESILPGQGPAANRYRLTPKNTFADGLPTVAWQLVLSQPEADAALDTTRIALMRNPTQIEYYAASTWTDRAPLMVQTLMLESFENSDRIIAVGRRALGLRADYELKTELRELQAEYFDGQQQAKVGINAKLVRLPEREIVGSQSFEWTVAFAEDSMPVIVQAFDDALGHVLKDLVAWTLITGEAFSAPA